LDRYMAASARRTSSSASTWSTGGQKATPTLAVSAKS
jgi:hypothetical protein